MDYTIRPLLILLVFSALLTSCSEQEIPEPQSQSILLVLNKSEHTATALDTDSGEKLATFVTGIAPHEAAVFPETSQAVITNYGTRENPGSSLTVVDLKNLSVVKTIDLGKYRRPHGIQPLSDGSRTVVTVEGNQAVLVVNIDSGEIEKSIRTEQRISHMLALSPDEKTAYVSNMGSDSISVLDLGNSRLIQNIRTGDGAEGLDVSPDGKELWVANRGDDSLSIIDTQSLKILENLDCESFPIRVRFTPDGDFVLISNARSGDIAVFSAGSREEIRRIPMEFSVKEKESRMFNFDLSPVPIGIITDPEGHRAFVANSNADIVSIIDLKQWQVAGRLIAGQEPDGMVLTVISTDVEVSE